MERLIVFVDQTNLSKPTNYIFKVPLVGHFMSLIGVIRLPVESPLEKAFLDCLIRILLYMHMFHGIKLLMINATLFPRYIKRLDMILGDQHAQTH